LLVPLQIDRCIAAKNFEEALSSSLRNLDFAGLASPPPKPPALKNDAHRISSPGGRYFLFINP